MAASPARSTARKPLAPAKAHPLPKKPSIPQKTSITIKDLAILAAISLCGYAGYRRISIRGAAPAAIVDATPLPVDACAPSGVNASQLPMKRYMIPPGGLAGEYINAFEIFRAEYEKDGARLPKHLDPSLLAMKAHMESNGGRDAYTKGNSYIGLLGFSPTRSSDASTLAEHEGKVLAMLNGAKSRIGVFQKCAAVTRDMIYDADYYYDVTVQSFFSLTTAVQAEKQLAKLPNYNDSKKMTPDMRRAAHYVFHNLPAIAKFAINHIDSKLSIAHLLKKEKHPQIAALVKFMNANPSVYPPNVTPAQLFQNIINKTKASTRMVDAYDAAAPMDMGKDSAAIGDFLKDTYPEDRKAAAPHARPVQVRVPEHLARPTAKSTEKARTPVQPSLPKASPAKTAPAQTLAAK